MPAYGLFHSFPRPRGLPPEAELLLGRSVLESIFDLGLLLTPETITYPLVLDGRVDYGRGSVVHQLRACFTLIEADEVVDHGVSFGVFSLEFDVDVLRSIGAFPVIYVPQPVLPHPAPADLSVVGNNLVHQVRDVAILLQELMQLEEAVAGAAGAGVEKLEVTTARKHGTVTTESAEMLLDYLLGSKVSFANLYHLMEVLAHFFYHADSARRDQYVLRNDLAYYGQREWRVISGFATADGGSMDRPLTAEEVGRLEASSDFFRSSTEVKGGRRISRARCSRAISRLGLEPFWRSVRRFHVPDAVYDEIAAGFERRGLPTSLLCRVPFAAVHEERERLRVARDAGR